MKRSLIHILMLCGLLIASLSAQANDYLELEKHYMIYTSGASSIHFKIPVWAYGKARNYYIHESSYAIYGVQGKDKDGCVRGKVCLSLHRCTTVRAIPFMTRANGALS